MLVNMILRKVKSLISYKNRQFESLFLSFRNIRKLLKTNAGNLPLKKITRLVKTSDDSEKDKKWSMKKKLSAQHFFVLRFTKTYVVIAHSVRTTSPSWLISFLWASNHEKLSVYFKRTTWVEDVWNLQYNDHYPSEWILESFFKVIWKRILWMKERWNDHCYLAEIWKRMSSRSAEKGSIQMLQHFVDKRKSALAKIKLFKDELTT